MNGHTALLLFAGLAGVTGLSVIGGAESSWVILILLILNGVLIWSGTSSLSRIKNELVGISITLFGKRGDGGLFRDVTDRETGLLRSRIEQAQAIRIVVEQQRAIIRTLAECQTQGEISVRMRPYLSLTESQALELEKRMRALELVPSAYVKAD